MKQLKLDLEPKPVVVLGPLAGPAGNAYAILGACHQAWIEAHGKHDPGWDVLYAELTSGDYEHLLDVVEDNFTVVGTAVVATPDWRDQR